MSNIMFTDWRINNRERNEIMERQDLKEQAKSLVHPTMSCPNKMGTAITVPARPPSYFPMRHSSIVNTFKQQQRINLVRNMFLKLTVALPTTDHTSQRAHTAPESHLNCTPQLDHSQAVPPRVREPRLSYHRKSPTYGRHSIGQVYQTPFPDISRSFVSDAYFPKPHSRNTQSHSAISTVNINAAITEKKNIHSKNNRYQTQEDRGKSKHGTHYFNKCLTPAINHMKKDVEKNEISRERLQYYQKTYHIVNYYLNQEAKPEGSISTARDGTHLLELLSSSEAIPATSPQISKGKSHLQTRGQFPVPLHECQVYVTS